MCNENKLGLNMPTFAKVSVLPQITDGTDDYQYNMEMEQRQEIEQIQEPEIQVDRKILSIDFDIIMYSCINIYNDLCTGVDNSYRTWERIELERNADKFLNYDSKVLNQIARALVRNINAEFIKIEEHHQIINWIKEHNVKCCDIVNVDFHHDILYHGELDKIVYFDKYDCSNWLGYLIAKEYTHSVTWIKAPNSQMPVDALNVAIRPLVDIDLLNGFDTIFWCFSPQWVPYKYRHLYEMIWDMVMEMKQ